MAKGSLTSSASNMRQISAVRGEEVHMTECITCGQSEMTDRRRRVSDNSLSTSFTGMRQAKLNMRLGWSPLLTPTIFV